jgi:hypothetical protein
MLALIIADAGRVCSLPAGYAHGIGDRRSGKERRSYQITYLKEVENVAQTVTTTASAGGSAPVACDSAAAIKQAIVTWGR